MGRKLVHEVRGDWFAELREKLPEGFTIGGKIGDYERSIIHKDLIGKLVVSLKSNQYSLSDYRDIERIAVSFQYTQYEPHYVDGRDHFKARSYKFTSVDAFVDILKEKLVPAWKETIKAIESATLEKDLSARLHEEAKARQEQKLNELREKFPHLIRDEVQYWNVVNMKNYRGQLKFSQGHLCGVEISQIPDEVIEDVLGILNLYFGAVEAAKQAEEHAQEKLEAVG